MCTCFWNCGALMENYSSISDLPPDHIKRVLYGHKQLNYLNLLVNITSVRLKNGWHVQ